MIIMITIIIISKAKTHFSPSNLIAMFYQLKHIYQTNLAY